MICNKCGKETDSNSMFCTVCGARIGEPGTIINNVIKEPDFLTEDAEPTALLSDEALENAFINEYGGEVVIHPDPEPNQQDFFYNSNTSDNTDDLMPFNEYGVNSGTEIHEERRQKSFNDNSDTISIDAVEDELDEPPFPQPEPFPQPSPEPYSEAPPQMFSEQPPLPKVNNPKDKKVGALRVAGGFLISVLSIVFLVIFSLTLSIKLGLSGGIVRKNIGKMNNANVISSNYDGQELSDSLYDSLGIKTATGGTADESSFRNYLLRTDIVSYIGRTLQNYLSYIIDGKGSDPSVTSDDFVYDFIKSNNRASIEEWGYSMTDKDYKAMKSSLEKDGFNEDMSIKQWSEKLGLNLRNLKFLFSYVTIALFLVITALLFIWVKVIVRDHSYYVTLFFGSIFTFSGTLMILISGFSLLGVSLAYVFTHNVVFYLSSYAILIFSLIALCLGAEEMVLGRIFKAVRRKVK